MMKLSEEDGKSLIKIARSSISAALQGKGPEIEEGLKKKYSEKQGGFVTLTIDGELRGCIGYTEPIFPLWECIANAAKAAALEDPRFAPLSEEEFKNIKIEISVLTAPELIEVKRPADYAKKIEIGKHGLIVDKDGQKGLLLPQVFTEYKTGWERALEMTCQKAFLDHDAWKDKNCDIYRFSAEIFSEAKKA